MDVQHLGLDAQDLRALLDLGGPAAGQHRAGHLMMPDIAVGHADKLDLVAQLRPPRGGAAGRELAIIGVGAEDDDPDRFLGALARFLGFRGPTRDSRGHNEIAKYAKSKTGCSPLRRFDTSTSLPRSLTPNRKGGSRTRPACDLA